MEKDWQNQSEVEKYLKERSEIEEFLKERLPSPVGLPYFAPNDYKGEHCPLLVDLKKTHKVIWDLLMAAIGIVFVLAVSIPFALIVWDFPWWGVLGFLSVSVGLYGIVLEKIGEFFKTEGPMFWDRMGMTEVFSISLKQDEEWLNSRYDIEFTYVVCGTGGEEFGNKEGFNYHWKEVEPKKFIIADELTGKEAPLLPGIKPYSTA